MSTTLAENFVSAYLSPNENQTKNFVGEVKADQELIGKFYKINDTTVCCALNDKCLDISEATSVASEILKACNDENEVVVLTSRHKRNLLDLNELEMESEAIPKILQSTAWKHPGTKANLLTQPNVLSGFPAAILSQAELRKMSCLLVCNFVESESIDSRSLSGFKLAVQKIPFITIQNDQISQQRLKQCYQKSNTLYT